MLMSAESKLFLRQRQLFWEIQLICLEVCCVRRILEFELSFYLSRSWVDKQASTYLWTTKETWFCSKVPNFLPNNHCKQWYSSILLLPYKQETGCLPKQGQSGLLFMVLCKGKLNYNERGKTH